MSGPGSLTLDQLITQAGGSAVVADLRRFYGVDLAQLWHGTVSPRRVIWLIEHLPEDSATVAALRGGAEHRAWTSTTHLLAAVVDAVQLGTWALVATNSKRRPAAPKPLPRPSDGRARTGRVVTVAEIAARREGVEPPDGG